MNTAIENDENCAENRFTVVNLNKGIQKSKPFSSLL